MSRIHNLIGKVKLALDDAKVLMPDDEVKEFIDKLNGAIDLHNNLVTVHSGADGKIRLDAFREAEKSLIRLLKEVKDLSRKYANEKLVRDMKTLLNHDDNVSFPDGTVAPYPHGGVSAQPSAIAVEPIATTSET
ncbi:hypothetical protein DL96DRAFT_1686457 [Flagelloscypha sp. PMI_526]|nr:hypothetical protein DL96DRAFT_1686457 [Flagelloscypha sp. PMI_526]